MKTKTTAKQTATVTDEALASFMQNGSKSEKETALAEIYRRWKDKIYITFFRGLNIPEKEEVAKDLAQNTFMKVFSNIGNFNQNSARFSTWIYTIAHNELIDFKRKQRYEILHYEGLKSSTGNDEAKELVFQLKCTNKIADEMIMADQRAQAVRDAIAEAVRSEQGRTMVYLRYFDDMSYEEIAERLGVPKNTVKSTLSRAKDKIKEHLEKISVHA